MRIVTRNDASKYEACEYVEKYANVIFAALNQAGVNVRNVYLFGPYLVTLMLVFRHVYRGERKTSAVITICASAKKMSFLLNLNIH